MAVNSNYDMKTLQHNRKQQQQQQQEDHSSLFILMCKQMDFAQFHNYEKIRQLIKRALQAFSTFLAHKYIEATIHQAYRLNQDGPQQVQHPQLPPHHPSVFWQRYNIF